jgi:diketogulonate reductase-like aldo/keto reductase
MIRLVNGVEMPQVGLGTYQMNESDLATAIPASLDEGYRCFDTAASYRNEQHLGEILHRELASRGLFRRDVFITSKLRPADHGYESAKKALATSAMFLGGYVDLFLIHWPGVAKKSPSDTGHSAKRAESWRALQDALDEGVHVRAIGVSNYNISHLEDMLQDPHYRTTPMVNQVEIHPAHHPVDLTEYCNERGIHIQAYSSLGRGELLKPEIVKTFPKLIEIATNKCQITASDLSSPLVLLPALYLKWAVQRGFSVIPKSVSPGRIRANYQACMTHDDLTIEEMEYIDGMQDSMAVKYCWDASVVL